MKTYRIANGVFTPRFWPTLITLIMLALLVMLGTWQMHRLSWKENLISTIQMRMKEAPVSVQALTNIQNSEYRRASAWGIFQHDKKFFLHAISLTGQGGYHVLTPLRLKDGRYLLVNRGWIPYDKKQPMDFDQPKGSVTARGILRLAHHYWLQPASTAEQNEWHGIDLPKMAAAISVPEFLPFILEADETPNSSGYPIGGQTRLTLSNNHLGYAVTWYGLAFALLIIYGVSSFRKDDAG